jgi:hypothetical protein
VPFRRGGGWVERGGDACVALVLFLARYAPHPRLKRSVKTCNWMRVLFLARYAPHPRLKRSVKTCNWMRVLFLARYAPHPRLKRSVKTCNWMRVLFLARYAPHPRATQASPPNPPSTPAPTVFKNLPVKGGACPRPGKLDR